MYTRKLKPPQNKSFFLFGPRGIGKTTWVKKTFPKALYLDLLEAELYTMLLANPQRLENLIPPKNKEWIIIDEVQKVPELLNEVHRLIEKNKYKFILTGSSARKLRRKGHNLLGGRALTYSMFPLSIQELGKDFDIEKSLSYGHLPTAYIDKDPKKYLESYVKTYLDEEIRQEGLTRNLSAFSRFLEAASFSQGSVLNLSAVSRECGVERKVIENYFNILEDLLIAYKLPVFTKKAKRRMIAHPKFYFFDVGVFRTIRPKGPLDQIEEIDGPALETLFLQEIKAFNAYNDLDYKIFYWRTSNNVEVDFIIYGPKGLFAFEIKRSSRISKDSFTGLKAFLKDYPMAKAFYLYNGTRKLYQDNIESLPLKNFFNNIADIL
ncbi:MAG: AAA family ATPase [Candidatus Omnitrophica bacterium]|nr:AAA family ATPase [Candidatus Omnitrophota bacterium]